MRNFIFKNINKYKLMNYYIYFKMECYFFNLLFFIITYIQILIFFTHYLILPIGFLGVSSFYLCI